MAILPLNINDVFITIQRLDRINVLIDSDFGEPIGEDIISTETTTLLGQVNFRGGPIRRRGNTVSGDQEPTDGHVLFRFDDLVDAGLAITTPDISFVVEKGDRIVQIASQEVNFEIIEIRPESPLDSIDADSLLIYMKFKAASEERVGRI